LRIGVGVDEGPGSARPDSVDRSPPDGMEEPIPPLQAATPASSPTTASAVRDRGMIGFLIAVLC